MLHKSAFVNLLSQACMQESAAGVVTWRTGRKTGQKSSLQFFLVPLGSR